MSQKAYASMFQDLYLALQDQKHISTPRLSKYWFVSPKIKIENPDSQKKRKKEKRRNSAKGYGPKLEVFHGPFEREANQRRRPIRKQLSNCTRYLLKKGRQKKKRRGKEGRHEPSKIRQGILGLVVKRVGGFFASCSSQQLSLVSMSLSVPTFFPYPSYFFLLLLIQF